MMIDKLETPLSTSNYDDDSIRTLDWNEHIRLRPGMYIGRLGDGKDAEDGIYVLLKEVIDNCIDEFTMGFGKTIRVDISDGKVSVRDQGRGIPFGKMIDAASKMNTGAKYDSKTFKKSVGLNGVGIKAVNALSSFFRIQCFRENETRFAEFERGCLLNESPIETCSAPNGTLVEFIPDSELFPQYEYVEAFVERMLKHYVYLNTGLVIVYNGQKMSSKNGLEDLLNENITSDSLYPIIHLSSDDIEIAFTHTNQYGEECYSFVNSQHTTAGGTHQTVFREAISRTLKDFFAKNHDYADIRMGMVSAVSIKVEEPVFESQTKTKLGSRDMSKDGPTINKYVNDFLKKELDNFMHRNPAIAEVMLKKINQSEKERKSIDVITKKAKVVSKKVNMNNRKLRDCRFHYNDAVKARTAVEEDEKRRALDNTCLFITEGDSASGSITKSRDVNYQAVFSLRGKPLNCFGKTKKVVYENEEFNLLQAALNIEDSLDDLRYNKVIIATDADVDGMHIRLLMLTFFLQFFPDLIKRGHVYILQTPLFRVRNKKEAVYCYSEEERIEAIKHLGPNPEITRFKGLGEISPDEFRDFIGENIRLDKVSLRREDAVKKLLEFYMGKNTPERQRFMIDNLIVEGDIA